MREQSWNTVRDFVECSDFIDRGAVIADLDGTLVVDCSVAMCKQVLLGLQRVLEERKHVLLNTLQPPERIRSWLIRHHHPFRVLPVVALNGAVSGTFQFDGRLRCEFERSAVHVLGNDQIRQIVELVQEGRRAPDAAIILFGYLQDGSATPAVWCAGCSPTTEQIANEYRNIMTIGGARELSLQLQQRRICLLYLLRERRHEPVSLRHWVFTGGDMDKRKGAQVMADALDIDLGHSIGAGDGPFDSFLDAVGLAIHVGAASLPFQGRWATIREDTPEALGEVLHRVARLLSGAR